MTITAISVILFFYFKSMTTKRDGEYQNHGVIRYNNFTAIHIQDCASILYRDYQRNENIPAPTNKGVIIVAICIIIYIIYIYI